MIPVYEPYFTGKEKEYVNDCLDSTWISSKGPWISRFEQKFADYTGALFATTVTNGTVALHLALETLGISPGDEVIVPTLTYIASVNTILQTGAKPVYVDSLEHSLQIDPDDVIKKISPRTKAVMAVHLYGSSCDMDALVAICKQHNLYLIEDCAEAFGTWYKGRHVGTFGDIATFSFFGNKTITTGEGGMVVSQSEELMKKACHLKNQGVSLTQEYYHDLVGFNYRMTNICAAIGCAQIEQADEILAKKRDIAALYREELAGLPLKVHEEEEQIRHSYWMCSIILDNPEHQTPLREFLKNGEIETRPFFHPAHTLPHCSSKARFPIAESLSSRGINLPSSPTLGFKDLTYICEKIRIYFNNV